MGVEESPIVREVLKNLAESTQKNYKVTLTQLLEFVNSKEGLSKEISIDNVVALAKSDVKEIQTLIDNFYYWLQNEKVEGYELRGKTMRGSSAYQKAYGYVLGFFVNLDIVFQRKWGRSHPKPERRQAIKKDSVYSFYELDEETRTIRFNRERMQQFLTNLKLRDVAITLALLSSSQDSGDLFKLNVGDIRAQEDKNRIYWEGYRGKSKVLFKTFISKEATKFIRDYIRQQRQGAGDKEPLFVYTRYENGEPVEKRMTANNLSSIFRDAARKIGIKWENGEHNPLRPKRMRHLFRTACDTVKPRIPELYINAFMGHSNSQGQDYSELTRPQLELEYTRVEPYFTVYGEVEESLEFKETVRDLNKQIMQLNIELSGLRDEVKEQRGVIDELSEKLLRKFERVARKHIRKWLWEELTPDELKEVKEAQRALRKRIAEEVKEEK